MPHLDEEAKSRRYVEQLAAWQSTNSKRGASHAAAFLAVKKDVAAAMAAGYTMKTIWEHMHATGRLRCGYEAFRRYANKFIANAPPPSPPQLSLPKEAAPKPAMVPTKLEGFSFDPTARKEDLL